MDLTLGSGWPYGGPQFPAGAGAGRLLTQVVQVPAGQKSVPAPTLRDGQSLIGAFVGKGNSGLGAIGGRGRGVSSNAGKIDLSTMKEVPIRSGVAVLGAERRDPAEVVFCIAESDGHGGQAAALGGGGLRDRSLQPGG